MHELRVKLAIVTKTDESADDVPMDGVAVRCVALPDGGSGSSPDAHSPVDGGDWRTATLRLGEAYPAEAPSVEFQSSAVGFNSRQASDVQLTGHCSIEMCSQHRPFVTCCARRHLRCCWQENLSG